MSKLCGWIIAGVLLFLLIVVWGTSSIWWLWSSTSRNSTTASKITVDRARYAGTLMPDKSPASHIAQIRSTGSTILDTICLKTGECYVVIDRIVSIDGKAVQRSIEHSDYPDPLLSVNLTAKTPQDTAFTSYTGDWLVNPMPIAITSQLIVAAMEAATSVIRSSQRGVGCNILHIGDSTAAIAVYVANVWPEANQTVVNMEQALVDLVETWFGLDQGENYRVVHEKWTHLLFQSALIDYERKFDLIVVGDFEDTTDFDDPSLRLLHNAYDALRDYGVIIFTEIPFRQSRARSLFSTCSTVSRADRGSVSSKKILICWKETAMGGFNFREQFGAAIRGMFGLRVELGKDVVN